MKTVAKTQLSTWEQIKLNKHRYILLAPFMLAFTYFTIIPVITAIALSFTNFNLIQVPKFTGLMNYVRLFFNDDIFLIAVRNTLLLAFITAPAGYILSWILAWFITDLSTKMRTVLTFVFYVPALVGNIFFIWSYIFSGDAYGLLNGFLLNMKVISEPIQWLTDLNYNMSVVIIVQLWLSLGIGFLAFVAGFQSMDRSLFEAGSIDGVQNRWQELWYITLPQMKPQLLFSAVMQIAGAFSISAVPMALTGFPSVNYSTHTIVTHIIDFGTLRFEMGYACAISAILFLMMYITKILFEKLISMIGH